ncbi:MAG: WD40-repeat-containing domain protein [Benniella sp.]|nr:hypothetical protein BGX34_000841 [Mortierella sp. NVP85]KAK3819741.1 MAG: WD40-repeat-containing domain protein [Benniella sp.]
MQYQRAPRMEQTIAGFPTLKTREYRAHKANVHTVGWNSDGRRLASGSVDKTARVWAPERTSDPRSSLELRGHTDSVDQLVWDPTHPDHLATASCDKTVRIWDARSAKSIHKIDTSGQNINISWSPDGQHIAVGNKDDMISFIDTRTFKIEQTVQFKVEVNEISWNPVGNLFLLTTGQGSVKVLEYPSMKELHLLEAHTANCYCLEFDPRGKYLATGSADALVNLWELEEYTCVRTFGKLDWPIRTISFSFDGEFLASASEDLAIDISLVETGESVHTIECFAAMNTVAWHPSKYLLAYAGDEQEPRPGGGTAMIGNLRIFGFSG